MTDQELDELAEELEVLPGELLKQVSQLRGMLYDVLFGLRDGTLFLEKDEYIKEIESYLLATAHGLSTGPAKAG